MVLPEYEHEMALTRKVLERVPDDKFDWKAHPKSNTMGWVACHLAEIPGWVAGTFAADSWDVNPPGGEPYKSPNFKTTKEVLALFDKNVAEGKKALEQAKDAEFALPWSLKNAGQVYFTVPKGGVIRTWVLNHSIHHRAILTVYLRLNDLPVPSLYGPSGDEQG